MPRTVKPADLHKDPHSGRIKCAAIAVLVGQGGNVFLAKRAKPPFEEYYEGVGGGIEVGERISTALFRELREETGLSRRQIRRAVFAGFDEHIIRPGFHRIRFVHGVLLKPGVEIKLTEHKEGAWFHPDRLPKKVFPGFARMIRLAVAALKK